MQEYAIHTIDANHNRLTSVVKSSWDAMSDYCRHTFDHVLAKGQGLVVYDNYTGSHLETVMKYG